MAYTSVVFAIPEETKDTNDVMSRGIIRDMIVLITPDTIQDMMIIVDTTIIPDTMIIADELV